MKYSYKTNGTCAFKIDFNIDGDIISDIVFSGGCDGNHKAISSLCEGQKASYIIDKLSGIKCGFRDTSCGDQLAKAVEAAINENE